MRESVKHFTPTIMALQTTISDLGRQTIAIATINFGLRFLLQVLSVDTENAILYTAKS